MSDRNETQKAPNRLIQEKSPYLIQHAYNPVDWYPWEDEAFDYARKTDRPVFLSIGYATCHWCHVMAHESFEDKDVADLLNGSFVSVKVDREERPDVDQIYMTVCQLLTKSGGWPLSVFMTPDGKPFFAGTYFPKKGRSGIPGFMDLLVQLSHLWNNDRNRLFNIGEELTRILAEHAKRRGSTQELGEETLRTAFVALSRSFDPQWGGFSKAPKFPSPHQLSFLLRWHRRDGDDTAGNMVGKTLDAMRNGGIFDQIGLGFHRYSVDDMWLVPHFEKMLYDQAMLTLSYTEASLALGEPRYAAAARDICTYVLRDMTSPEGGFYSAEDADSEGVEGKFYVWTPEEIRERLGAEDGDLFCRFYDIRPGGNFEHGTSIPRVTASLESFARRENMPPDELRLALDRGRETLFQIREQRIHPLKDDKIITAWNGLMIAALARTHQAGGKTEHLEAACRSADFLLEHLRDHDGRLFRTWRRHVLGPPGFAEDYAFLIWGLIELYETCFELRYLEAACSLNETFLDLYWDSEGKGFFFTGKENEELISRSKEFYDGAVPSSNSVAALNLLRLGRMTGDVRMEERVQEMTDAFSAELAAHPVAHTHFLCALDFMLGPAMEIVVAGNRTHEDAERMLRLVHTRFLPNKVLLLKEAGEVGELLSRTAPFTTEFPVEPGQVKAYVCRQYACRSPVSNPEEFETALV